jgi:acid stress chaperone HdeB
MKMKSAICTITATVALALVSPAKAEVIDLSLVTCKELLASDPDRQILISSWMAGYFSASKNLNVVDFRHAERNRRVIGNYCKTHKSDTVMNAMQKNWRRTACRQITNLACRLPPELVTRKQFLY